jgi:hypothetical protein
LERRGSLHPRLICGVIYSDVLPLVSPEVARYAWSFVLVSGLKKIVIAAGWVSLVLGFSRPKGWRRS